MLASMRTSYAVIVATSAALLVSPWLNRALEGKDPPRRSLAEVQARKVFMELRANIVEGQGENEGRVSLHEAAEVVCLDLYCKKVSDEQLAHLKAFPKLRGVILMNTEVSDAGLRVLAELPNLERIELSQMRKITDAGLAYLSQSQHLRILSLAYTDITDDGLAHLKDLKNLETLTLNGTKTTDAGMEALSGMTKLKWLALNAKITDRGLAHIRDLTDLETLNLRGAGITDSGLEKLKNLTKLRVLWLDGTRITDAALAHLAVLGSLEKLSLRRTGVTDQGIEELKRSLPKAEIFGP